MTITKPKVEDLYDIGRKEGSTIIGEGFRLRPASLKFEDGERVPNANDEVGLYGTNNGVLAVAVKPSGVVYVGRSTKEAIQGVRNAGYRPGLDHVPHSRGIEDSMEQLGL